MLRLIAQNLIAANAARNDSALFRETLSATAAPDLSPLSAVLHSGEAVGACA